MIVVDRDLRKRNRRMSLEQCDGEDSTPGTEVIPGDEDTGESEVDLRLPPGAGLEPDRIPKDRPAAKGTASADTDTCVPEQTSRSGAVGGAKPKWPWFILPARDRTGCYRTPRHGRGQVGFCSTRRTRRIRAWINNQRAPGHCW